MDKKKCSISVIMAVYDNARELEQYLPAFLTQEYETDYEVIVVDESSTDETDDVLKLQKQSYPHLYTTFLPKPNRNVTRRKLALTIGVKAAKYDWVVISDIHSAPPSTEWLKEVADATDGTTDVIIGYFRKNDIRLQAFEEVSQVRRIISKAERKRAGGKQSRRLKVMRGKYDFVVVRRNRAHDLLKYFEQDISLLNLLGLRILVMFQNSK